MGVPRRCRRDGGSDGGAAEAAVATAAVVGGVGVAKGAGGPWPRKPPSVCGARFAAVWPGC
eukprot:11215491-Lingulodinium_polyedra.AAC.1